MAAGIFLLILRPLKVGDFMSAGGMLGTVEEIGLFVTRINTLGNVQTFIRNSRVFADTIQNFSTNLFRWVDPAAQLHNEADHATAIRRLKARVSKSPNVVADPKPDIEILQFDPLGPVLAVPPYCNSDYDWQVYFDTKRVIRESLGEARFHAAEQPIVVRTSSNGGAATTSPAADAVGRFR